MSKIFKEIQKLIKQNDYCYFCMDRDVAVLIHCSNGNLSTIWHFNIYSKLYLVKRSDAQGIIANYNRNWNNSMFSTANTVKNKPLDLWRSYFIGGNFFSISSTLGSQIKDHTRSQKLFYFLWFHYTIT